jgi:hypothetical protein
MLTAKGLISGVEKDAGAQIDAPPFGGMLHIGIGFLWIKGEMFGTPYKTFLKYIENRNTRHILMGWGILSYLLLNGVYMV